MLVGAPVNDERNDIRALCRRDSFERFVAKLHFVTLAEMMRVLGLVLCGMVAWGQKPSDADTAALIERSRQRALDYTQQLPDFICTEVVHRSISSGGGGQSTDTLTIKLGYSKRGEEHKLELINGKPTGRKYEELEGATGSGEFGGILRVIFGPASQAAFDWQAWKTVRKKRRGGDRVCPLRGEFAVLPEASGSQSDCRASWRLGNR